MAPKRATAREYAPDMPAGSLRKSVAQHRRHARNAENEADGIMANYTPDNIPTAIADDLQVLRDNAETHWQSVLNGFSCLEMQASDQEKDLEAEAIEEQDTAMASKTAIAEKVRTFLAPVFRRLDAANNLQGEQQQQPAAPVANPPAPQPDPPANGNAGAGGGADSRLAGNIKPAKQFALDMGPAHARQWLNQWKIYHEMAGINNMPVDRQHEFFLGDVDIDLAKDLRDGLKTHPRGTNLPIFTPADDDDTADDGWCNSIRATLETKLLSLHPISHRRANFQLLVRPNGLTDWNWSNYVKNLMKEADLDEGMTPDMVSALKTLPLHQG